jgi:hypothetical protein
MLSISTSSRARARLCTSSSASPANPHQAAREEMTIVAWSLIRAVSRGLADRGPSRPPAESLRRATGRPKYARRAGAGNAAGRRPQLMIVAGPAGRARPLLRYFYSEDVPQQDSLFRHEARSILKTEPTRTNKAELLARLRDKGVFLIDLATAPPRRPTPRPFAAAAAGPGEPR